MEDHEKKGNNLLKVRDEVLLEYESKELLRKSFTNKLSEIEKIHKQQIEAERNILLTSWRWRIGNFQVNLILAIRNFFLKTYRVISRSKYKVAGINYTTNSYTGNRSEAVDNPDTKKPTLACIFDTFTHSCFQPEFNIISPYPDNWKYILRKIDLEALFCESAWSGNDAAWRFLIGDIGDLKKKGLIKMVEAFRKKGLPTIFWNKEDPVHFDHFIDDARHFDYIFTTDQNIIPKYREVVNHDRIFPLPFAAQEKIHNPVRTEERHGSVCFAGTWYAAKYAERIIDMETILNPAMDYGLEIYDRNYGATRYEKVMYGFPEIYQPFIKGKLDYAEMVKAYKNYKVFLNVNSVRYSPTMFSRRVFELLACGTPVISTWSEGIQNLLGDNIVLFTDSEDETRRHLETLLNNERLWWSYSLRGIRKVMEEHTYKHRTHEVFKIAGLKAIKDQSLEFLAVCLVGSMDDIYYLSAQIKKQEYSKLKVMLVSDPVAFQIDQAEVNKVFAPYPAFYANNTPESLSQLFDICGHLNYAAIFRTNDYYGNNYLRDISLAINYSGAAVIGKKTCFKVGGNGEMELINKGWEYRFTDRIQTGALCVSYTYLKKTSLFELVNSELIQAKEMKLFSIDPWNYLPEGRYASKSSQEYCEV